MAEARTTSHREQRSAERSVPVFAESPAATETRTGAHTGSLHGANMANSTTSATNSTTSTTNSTTSTTNSTTSTTNSTTSTANGTAKRTPASVPRSTASLADQDRLPDVSEQVLTRLYAPPSVVVSARGDVMSIHGRSAPHLMQVSATSYNTSVFALVHEELRTPLVETLRRAISSNETCTSLPQCITTANAKNITTEFVSLTVRPLERLAIEHSDEIRGCYLVTFDDASGSMAAGDVSRVLMDAVQRTEQRYRELLNAVTDYVFTVTLEKGAVVHTQHGVNCVAVTGYASHEYYANPTLWIDMVHHDDRDAVRDHASRILTEHSAKPFEHRIIHKNGSVRWIRNVTVVHHNEQGEFTGYDGLVYDITDRKNAEEQLRESEEQFRFILEQSPLGVLLTNLNNRIVKANEAFCEMLGFGELELRRMTLGDIMPPEDRPKEAQIMESLTNGDVRFVRIETRFVSKDGETMWVHLHTANVRDARGNRVFALGIVENITARKQAELALRNSEARLNALMQNANDAVTITDEHGCFTYVSPSTARLFYYAPQMMLGKAVRDYIHPDDVERVIVEYRKLVEQPLNAMKTLRYRYRRADGTWADVECVATNLLKHPLIEGVVANTRDLSIRHEDRPDDGDGDEEG